MVRLHVQFLHLSLSLKFHFGCRLEFVQALVATPESVYTPLIVQDEYWAGL